MKTTPRKNKPKYTRDVLINLRNEAVLKEFKRLTGEPHHKDADYVVQQVLTPKFYLMPETLWLIIRGTGHYKKKFQKKK